MIKRITCIILTVLIAFTCLPVNVSAASYDFSSYPDMGVAVMEIKSGDTIVSNNADATYYPGSIIKLLNVMTVLDYLELDRVVTVEQAALDMVGENSSLADLEEGEQLTVEQLIYGALLPSGNDAAIVLGIETGRVILGNADASAEEANQAFVSQMNVKADNIGMYNTDVANSDGYDNPNNISTPNDIVKLGCAVLNNEIIMNVVGVKTYEVTTNMAQHIWESTNVFYYETLEDDNNGTQQNPYYDSRVFGLKSGYTDDGLRCFLFAAQDGEKTFVGAVLKVPTEDMEIWKRTHDIINYSFDNYYMVHLTPQEDMSINVVWTNPSFLIPFRMKLNMKYDTYACIDKDSQGVVNYTISALEGVSEVDESERLKLIAQVESGQTVAYADFYIDDVLIKSVELIAATDYKPAGMTDILLYGIFAAIIAGIVIGLRNVEKKRKRRIER